MSRVMDEMLKFFDAVSGGSGPYGWIYAAEYERYGIEYARFGHIDYLFFLDLSIKGEFLCVSFSSRGEVFHVNFLEKNHFSCKSLSELFDHLSTYGNQSPLSEEPVGVF